MEVGTIIPTRNPEPSVFSDAVASVRAQSPHRLIIVDDGSAEPVEVKGATVIRTPGLGISGARNAGIARLDTEAVHILDHDDLVRPGFYTAMRRLLDDHDIAFSECEFLTADGTPTGTYLTAERPDTTAIVPQLYRRNMIASSAAVFRRWLWLRYPFRPYRFVQDWDFWLRAARHGARFAFEPAPLAAHRLHQLQATAGAPPSVRLSEQLWMLLRQPHVYQPAAVARTTMHMLRARRNGL